MKKTLVAIAALAATGAFAQSSVTLYGNLDQSVFMANQNGDHMTGTNSNGGSTSLWGIKGVEDLGGGTKASFDLKSELTLANGQTGSASTSVNGTAATTNATTNANVFNRGAFIGLENDKLGAFKVGRQNNSWWEASTRFNNTGINSFGWANATAMASGTNTAGLIHNSTAVPSGLGGYGAAGATDYNVTATGTGEAFNGGWSIETPKFNGFSAKYGHGISKATYAADQSVGNVQSYSLNYTQGPVDVAYASTTRNDNFATGISGLPAMRNTLLGAAYTAGAVTVKAAYNQTRFMNQASGDGHDIDVAAYGLGYQVSPAVKVDFGYTTMKDKEVSDNKFTQVALVGSYSFSKRTSLYAGYGTGRNKGESRFGPVYGGNANAIPTGNQQGRAVDVLLTGIRHQF